MICRELEAFKSLLPTILSFMWTWGKKVMWLLAKKCNYARIYMPFHSHYKNVSKNKSQHFHPYMNVVFNCLSIEPYFIFYLSFTLSSNCRHRVKQAAENSCNSTYSSWSLITFTCIWKFWPLLKYSCSQSLQTRVKQCLSSAGCFPWNTLNKILKQTLTSIKIQKL